MRFCRLYLVIIMILTSYCGIAFGSSAEHDGIAYFTLYSPPRIERYDMNSEAWLTSIDLPDIPTAFTVDADGLYVSFGRRVSRFALDGSGETHLQDTSSDVRDLFTMNDYLYVSVSNQLLSINKFSGVLIDSSNYIYGMRGFATAPSINRAFARSTVSPSDIVKVVLYGNGTFGPQDDSPYHAEFPSAARTYVFPGALRVTDSSGIVYNTADLTYNNNFTGDIDDIAFYGDLPIILRNDTLISFSNILFETGRYVPLNQPEKIYLLDEFIYSFYHSDDPRGIEVEKIALNLLTTWEPGQPVDPDGLAYTPDAVICGEDGIVYLLSNANLSIFRWSVQLKRYVDTIPLFEGPEYMAYSADTDHLYLAYPSRKITQIDLNNSLKEEPFVNSVQTPLGLATAGEDLFFSGFRKNHFTYCPEGELISEEYRHYLYRPSEYIWNEANRKMYYINLNAICWENIDTNGVIGEYYSRSSGVYRGTIFVAPDGSIALLETGQIFDAITLEQIDALSNNIEAAAWLDGILFTLRANNSNAQIQKWGERYANISTAQADGEPIRMFAVDDGLLAITKISGTPNFYIWDVDLKQTHPEDTSNPTEVTLISPSNDAYFVEGTSTILHATAIDSEDGDISDSIQWHSNLDGDLGTGSQITVTLSSGEHIITTEVINSADVPTSSSIRIIIIDSESNRWLDTIEHSGISYFIFELPSRIERYDIISESWLPSIELPDIPTAFTVDANGIYVSFGRRVSRFILDGSGEMHLQNTSYDVQDLFTMNDFLYIYFSNQLMSINKFSGEVIDSAGYTYRMQGLDIAPSIHKIFARSNGVSPSDIVEVVLNNDGTLGTQDDSPYHGDYPYGTKTYVFPGDARVADSSGIVYNTSDLTYNNSLAGTIDDLEFYGDIPIILRGDTLFAYSNTFLETGSYVSLNQPEKIYLEDAFIYSFYHSDDPRGTGVEKIPLTLLNPQEPGQPVHPDGLPYIPDAVILGEDGIVYLLSNANLSIFRWSVSLRSYLETVPLVKAAKYMAYSADTNHLYLAYSSGKITRIDLNGSLNEEPFVDSPQTPFGLATAGEFVFACYLSGSQISHYIYNPEREIISQLDWRYMSYEYIWNEANRKMYFFREGVSPRDIYWQDIDISGVIGVTTDSPYHSSAGIVYPIRVSPDGSTVLLGSGRIYDAITLEQIDSLSNNIEDAVWVDGTLFTIRTYDNGCQIQEWAENYAITSSSQLYGEPMRIFALGDGYMVITELNGIPGFWVWNSNRAPVICSINPSTAELHTQVNIYGTNFGGTRGSGYVSFFDKITAAEIISWSDHMICCNVPVGVESGCVTVTTDQGTSNCFDISILLDSDGDGLLDLHEDRMCTKPNDADTDDDGILDGIEDVNRNAIVDYGETDPCNNDTDGDGIQDGTELGYTPDNIGQDTDKDFFQPDLDPSTTTDPLNADADGDGLEDGEEDINHNGRFDSGESDPNIKPLDIFGICIGNTKTFRTGPHILGTEVVDIDQTTFPVTTYLVEERQDGNTVISYYEKTADELRLWGIRYPDTGEFYKFSNGLVSVWDPIKIRDRRTSSATVFVNGYTLNTSLTVDVISKESVILSFDSFEAFKLRYRFRVWGYGTNNTATSYEWVIPYLGTVQAENEGIQIKLTDFSLGSGAITRDSDRDGDGLMDYQELILYGTNYYNDDTDYDGLTDPEEIQYATDPNNWDSDGDGTSDGLEVDDGTDPNNPSEYPENLEHPYGIDNLKLSAEPVPYYEEIESAGIKITDYSSELTDYEAENTTDEEPNTCWSSSGTEMAKSEFIIYNLGEIKRLGKIEVFLSDREHLFPKNFKVSVSEDGSDETAWCTVVVNDDFSTTEDSVTWEFIPREVQYIKISGQGMWDDSLENYYVEIEEVKFYRRQDDATNSLHLEWTSPEDPEDYGVSEYCIQYKKAGSMEWQDIDDEPVPSSPSATEHYTLCDLFSDTEYDVRICSGDSDGNWSLWAKTSGKTMDHDFVDGIILLTPSDEEKIWIGEIPEYGWGGDIYNRYAVQFSNSPTFPNRAIRMPNGSVLKTLSHSIRGQENSFIPTALQWKNIKKLATEGGGGTLYWRVEGRIGWTIGYSETRHQYDLDAGAIIQQAPAEGGSIALATPPEFEWTYEGKGIVSFSLEIAVEEDMLGDRREGINFPRSFFKGITETKYVLGDREWKELKKYLSKKYTSSFYWRVKGTDADKVFQIVSPENQVFIDCGLMAPVLPAYGEIVSSELPPTLNFSYDGAGFSIFQVQLSTVSDFSNSRITFMNPRMGTILFNGFGFSRALDDSKEWLLHETKEWAGVKKWFSDMPYPWDVYWRVVGTTEDKTYSVISDVSVFRISD